MAACGLLATAVFLLPLTGCGGGSGDGGIENPDTGTKVPVTGVVVDYLTGVGIAGYSVSFNGTNATTDSTGNFSVNAAPTTASANLTLSGPAKTDGTAQYYGTVLYNSKTYTNGTIPLNPTTGQTSVSVGTITVGNVDTTPPFPPTL